MGIKDISNDVKKLDTIAARITWLREVRGMSAADLCRATKTQTQRPIAHPSLWALENGKTKSIKADTLFRIAAALNASPTWIKTGEGDPFLLQEGTTDELVEMVRALPDDKRAMIIAAIKAIT